MVERRLQDLPEQLMPMILLRQNGGGCIVLSRRIHTNEENQRELRFQLIMPEVSDKAVEMSGGAQRDLRRLCGDGETGGGTG